MTENLMASTWTPEARVRRRLTAGPKRKNLELETLTPLQAVNRAFDELLRARVVLAAEGVAYGRLSAELTYYVSGAELENGETGAAHIKHLAIRGLSTKDAIESLRIFERLAGHVVIFLGIDWTLQEGDPTSFAEVSESSSWITFFAAYPWDAKEITRMLQGA